MKKLILISLVFMHLNTYAQDVFLDVRDNNEYSVIKIGDQVWFAENLKFLPKADSPEKYSLKKKMYYVQHFEKGSADMAMQTKEYKEGGVFYNYEAAVDACPTGWHLPSSEEWGKLTAFIIAENGGEANGYTMARGSVSGSWELLAIKLKSVEFWDANGGTNNYKFNGIPTGYYNSYAKVFNDTKGSYWWSLKSELDVAYYRSLSNSHNTFTRSRMRKDCGLSVRCIKGDLVIDNEPEQKKDKKEYCEFVSPYDPEERLNVICEDDDLDGHTWSEIKEMTKKWGGKCYKK